MIGKTLSHFLIESSLGRGGMGEVFRAHDSKLERDVALKLLPEELAADRERLERFQREAKLAAALNHPNIVTLFSVEEAEGVHFLVMELVLGETLSALLPAKGFSPSELFDLAIPIVDAVSHAHDQGIVHRDLKTSNVMVTTQGQIVKVLDFGLAKAIATAEPEDLAQAPTELLTEAGLVVGTLPYMSPEQVEGRPVDHRTDVFSLGVLLFEMATGERPFAGDSQAALLSAILRDAPPSISQIRADLHPDLDRVVQRCLEKQPDRRFQSAADLGTELERLRQEVASPPGHKPRPESDGAERDSSIAVLPFLNRNGSPDDDYFSDGLSEELINALSRLPGIKVTARSSAFQFRGQELDVREVGRSLGVDAVLEGSVRTAGSRFRITTELVNCEDGLQLWSERFDGEMKDIFDTQDEIARAIVKELEVELGGKSGEPLVRRGTDNLEAYHLLLKARHHMTEFWEPGLVAAIDCLEQAVELDPNYAQAYALMGECHLIRATFGGLPGKEAFPRVHSTVRRALELDPELGTARGFYGIYLAWHDFDWLAADRQMRLAIELSPQNVWNHFYYAAMLATARREDEVVAPILLSRDLDPLNPLIHAHVPLCLFYAGRTDEAEAEALKAQELFPEYWLIPYFRSFIHWKKNDGETTVALVEKAVEMTGESVPYVACYAAATHFWFGNEEAGQQWLDKVDAMAASLHVPATGRALVEITRGHTDRAIELIEQARAEHDGPFAWLRALSEQLGILRDERVREALAAQGLP